MSTWGQPMMTPPATPVLVRVGGGWMWLLLLGWLFTGPMWLMGFVSAISPPLDIECPPFDPKTGITPPCPALEEASAAKMTTFTVTLVVVLVATCIITFIIGAYQGGRNTGLMYGRTGLLIATALFSTPHLVAYLLGYWLGKLMGPKDAGPAAVPGPTQYQYGYWQN